MQNVTDRTRNPFGMTPDCDRYVPGYGDVNADFHVIGDHPGVHGGIDEGIPFTGQPWSAKFFDVLAEVGLVADDDPAPDTTELGDDVAAADADMDAEHVPIRVEKTFFSYLHMCVPEGTPTAESYDDMERFFDAELRAIVAHVLLPVGARATDHVLKQYTARGWKTEIDMDALHGEELLGSGWLVVPIQDPVEWTGNDAERLIEALRVLRTTDFRRESDLGRFIAGSDPYLVR